MENFIFCEVEGIEKLILFNLFHTTGVFFIPSENMMFSGGIEIELWYEMVCARKERFRSESQKVPKAREFVEIIYSDKFKNKQNFNS